MIVILLIINYLCARVLIISGFVQLYTQLHVTMSFPTTEEHNQSMLDFLHNKKIEFKCVIPTTYNRTRAEISRPLSSIMFTHQIIGKHSSNSHTSSVISRELSMIQLVQTENSSFNLRFPKNQIRNRATNRHTYIYTHSIIS